MKMKSGETYRGFPLIEFKDFYDSPCSIQKSSIATENAIWFGVNDADPKIMASKVFEGGKGWIPFEIPEDVLLTTRMHLTQEQVKELLPILTVFAETGELSKSLVDEKKVKERQLILQLAIQEASRKRDQCQFDIQKLEKRVSMLPFSETISCSIDEKDKIMESILYMKECRDGWQATIDCASNWQKELS